MSYLILNDWMMEKLMNNSRTKKSIRNTIVALVEQGIYTVMSFLCRTVFIYSLGKTYLGFSGLFSDILTLLSLAELGVGTAILYSMYKPTAKGDHKHNWRYYHGCWFCIDPVFEISNFGYSGHAGNTADLYSLSIKYNSELFLYL